MLSDDSNAVVYLCRLLTQEEGVLMVESFTVIMSFVVRFGVEAQQLSKKAGGIETTEVNTHAPEML